MISPQSENGLLNKAFQLACFILGDREAALRVVTDALAKLEVVSAAQYKRLYYRPTGRRWSRRSQANRFRNNISFDKPHLLQRLIYLESEPYELAQEQAKTSEEDLVIHFIKHLTKKTIKRNSFYVTLGLSRLLYSYTTAETMDIYNAVIQDPARVKDDFYYRSRKGVLMQELKQRFGGLIEIDRGPRGEERFEADDNQGRFVALVREALSFFTPWHTACLVPAGIDPITDGISSFSYRGHSEEDKIEVNRIHAVIHPDCFQRLTTDLRFDAPDNRLAIPRFLYANDMNGSGSNNSRRNQPKLDEQEIQSITKALDTNAARRKAAHASLLRIMVDGVEQARIDLMMTRHVRFSLDKDAELIEVRSHGNSNEDVLLATHLLDHEEAQTGDTSIILEGGQKISIHLASASNEQGAAVEISYREANPLRAASLWFHQLMQSASSRPSRSIWKDRRVFVAALVVLFSISFAVVMRYVRREGSRAPQSNQIAAIQPTSQAIAKAHPTNAVTDNGPSTAGATNTAKSSNSPKGAEARQNFSSPEITAGNSAQEKSGLASEPGTVTETRTTRALRATPLSAVKRVYVEVTGDEPLSQNVRQALVERLRPTNLVISGNRDQADALLKVTVVKSANGEPEKTNALVELINPRGIVIWSKSGSSYQGSPTDVGMGIVRDLLAAIQESRQRK